MKTIRCVLLGLSTLVVFTTTMFAQATQNITSLNEGVHFEVAFGVVWAAPTEKPLPQPCLILISSRYATRVTVFSESALGAINKVYQIEPNKVLRVEIKTAYLSVTSGGKGANVVSITSEAPVSVSTYIAYQGNGTITLHYPVETWGMSYHVFSNPQDEYGVSGNIKRRPGQIVVIAAEDNTSVTVRSPVRIAASADHGIIAPNTPQTIQLQAHQTLTLLAAIDTAKSHTASTDLTGTRITSTKPVAVLSGHTKGAVGFTYPVLPPTGVFASEAHFVRNNYYQSLLPNALADTAFVTVPMLYTATRISIPDQVAPSDVVRILALNNGTVVRRSKIDGSGDSTVATLDSARYYTDSVVTNAFRWTTSRPALLMQYGKSYAKILPPGGVTQGADKTDISNPQGHPTVVSGMPTMMVVPGVSQWIERGTFYAPTGMDNFVSIVMKTEDVGSVLLRGQLISGNQLYPIPGTNLSYARLQIPEGDGQITTSPSAKFMAWNHGSLDGLAQGRAYSHPVGLSATSTCIDSVIVLVDSFRQYARAIASIDTSTDCSSMFRYEVLASKNAHIDSVDFRLNADSIKVFALQDNTDSAGTLTVRFTSTSGKYADADLYLAPVPPAPRVRHHVFLQIQAAKRYDTIVASVILDSAIDARFTQCIVYLRYNTRSIRRVTSFVNDTTVGTVHTTGFQMPITNRTAGTLLGSVKLVYQTPDTSIYPTITNVTWLEGTVPNNNVDNIFRTVVIDTLVDTTQVGVDDEPSPVNSTLTLALSPQPAHDIVSIAYNMGRQGGSLRMPISARTLRVYDMTGALVMDLSDRVVGEEGTMYVNTQGFASGMYVLQLSNGGALQVVKMFVE